jgi:hypothetical protein
MQISYYRGADSQSAASALMPTLGVEGVRNHQPRTTSDGPRISGHALQKYETNLLNRLRLGRAIPKMEFE